MPYLPVVIRMPGETQTILARIPPGSVAEWHAQRPGLLAIGFPDRPPDVDTRYLRVWLPRYGESQLPYWAAYCARLVRIGGEYPLPETWLRADATGAMFLVVSGESGFIARLLQERVDADGPSRSAWDHVAQFLGIMQPVPGGWVPLDPHRDRHDFSEIEAEISAAEADAREEGLLLPGAVFVAPGRLAPP